METYDAHPLAQVESVRLISPQRGVQAQLTALRVAVNLQAPRFHQYSGLLKLLDDDDLMGLA
jgi:hypothetical protein